MPIHAVAAIGYITAAISSGLALYHWRRSASLYALLVEGANRFEELRQRGANVEQALHGAELKAKQQVEANLSLTNALDTARASQASLTGQLEQKEHDGRLRQNKLELQKGHLERELAKAVELHHRGDQGLQTVRDQLTALQTELAMVRRSAHEERATLIQELTLREKDWQARLMDMERGKVAAEKAAKTGDPAELRRYKRKAAQYDRLYSSMKGLREMSDERNRNWEVALGKLSTWILEEKGFGPLPTAIGPLVGNALQAIGAQLVDDKGFDGEESREGAEHTGSMEAEDLGDDPEIHGQR